MSPYPQLPLFPMQGAQWGTQQGEDKPISVDQKHPLFSSPYACSVPTVSP